MDTARQEPAASGGKDRTVLALVLSGCGCLVLIAAVAILLFGKFIFAVRAPVDVVNAHLKALSEGDDSAAYSYLSSDYRETHSLADFRKALQPFRVLFPYRSTSMKKVNVRNNSATIEGSLTGSDGTVTPVSFELHQENNHWKIIHFTYSASLRLKT